MPLARLLHYSKFYMKTNASLKTLLINSCLSLVVIGCNHTDWPDQEIEQTRSDEQFEFSDEIAASIKENGVILQLIRPQSWMLSVPDSDLNYSLGEIDELGLADIRLDLLEADQEPEKWDLKLNTQVLSDTLETKSFKLGGKCGTMSFEVGRLELEYELLLTSESGKSFGQRAVLIYIAHEPTCRRDY